MLYIVLLSMIIFAPAVGLGVLFLKRSFEFRTTKGNKKYDVRVEFKKK